MDPIDKQFSVSTTSYESEKKVQNTNNNVSTTLTTNASASGLSRTQVAEQVALVGLQFADMTVQSLNALSAKREAWEKGAFKKANDELYAILADTLGVYKASEDFANSTKTKAHGQKHMSALRKELSDRLKVMGVKVQQNSSTLTMLTRYVFKSDRVRAHGYARVLAAALQDNIEPAGLHNYIVNAGGVEEIKRRMVLSEAALEKRAQIESVKNSVKADVEYAALNPIASVQLAAEGEFAVLLGKPNGAGFVDIVGVLSQVEQALVNALLLRIAKKRVADGVIEPVGSMTDAFAVPAAANDAGLAKQA